MKRKVYFALIFIVGTLILGNPPQGYYLRTLSEDFGSVHQGVTLGVSELQKIGTSSYHSYLLFSTYEYAFGTIKVKYLGLGFMTFYMGSNVSSNQDHSSPEDQTSNT